MKHLLAMAAALAGAASAAGQSSVYTTPEVPARETLDALNLKLGWRTYLPLETRRGRFVSVQPIGDQVFAFTRSGLLVALDGASGASQWAAQVTVPGDIVQPVAANDSTVFVAAGTRLIAISRRNGRSEWVVNLPTTPSAPPVADNERVYITLSTNRVLAYDVKKTSLLVPPPVPTPPPGADLVPATAFPGSTTVATDLQYFSPTGRAGTPSIQTLDTVTPPYRLSNGARTPSISTTHSVLPPYRLENGNRTPSIAALSSVVGLESRDINTARGVQPRLAWDFPADYRLEIPPVTDGDVVLVPALGPVVYALEAADRKPRYRVTFNGSVSAPMGQYAGTVYVPTDDSALTSVTVLTGARNWSVNTDGVIRDRPVVTDTDVYYTTTRTGVTKLNRLTGETYWRNGRAQSVVAVNPKFVYALDRSGVLLLLDRATGAVLTEFNSAAFTHPVVNAETDRLLLAGPTGLIVSVNDRDYPKPVVLRSVSPSALQAKPKDEPKKPAAPAEPKKDAEAQPAEPKKDEMEKK